jgi:cation transport ATPase
MPGGAPWVHFGLTQAQGEARPLAAIRREDPRAILDLVRLARATRRRETIAALLAFAFCLPPVWFALGGRVGLEFAALSPILGLAAVVVSAQFLHLFQPTASEVDEE